MKLEILARHYNLSDRQVVSQARLNLSYRMFLGIGLRSPLPHHTTLTYFRERLGAERLQQVFDALVSQARGLGVVKDRLRLKDATHIIANVAIPSTLRLVAQVRDRLLDALRPFAAERVQEEEQQTDAIHHATEDAKEEERLVQRVAHVRAIVAWGDRVLGQEMFQQGRSHEQERLRAALALAHKVLSDRDDPQGGDQVRSVHDSDARCGYHGRFYEGYLLDLAMDADSQLVTALNVLPANGDEGADAIPLIAQEEQAQGNHVAALSIDRAGYRGPLLQALTDPAGLNLEVFVPPADAPQPGTGFPPERFTLTIVDGREKLTCPGGAQAPRWKRSRHGNGWAYRFRKKDCGACALRVQCLNNSQSKVGRTVTKNDYEPVYAAARAKAQTPGYAAVRREHPAIERKLAEFVRRHELRRPRYRGLARVWYQCLMTGLVINLKRLVHLLIALGEAATGTMRPLAPAVA